MPVRHDCVFMQAFVVVGDYNGHIGLGVKCAKEVSAHSVRRLSCL